jgi:predicted RNase H-like HicB family nuclease
MEQVRRLTAVIEREDDVYVALCPEYDIASQGATIEEARANLIEALTLFFETADRDEVQRRGRSGVFVTQVEVPVGYASDSVRARSLRTSEGSWVP